MGDLSKNFNKAEFACRCGCGFDDVKPELVDVLQDVRDHFGAAVTVTSGCRCAEHNKREGGAPNSYHVKGMAADIQVQGVAPVEVYQYIGKKYDDKGAILYYRTTGKGGWVHVDVRDVKYRSVKEL